MTDDQRSTSSQGATSGQPVWVVIPPGNRHVDRAFRVQCETPGQAAVAWAKAQDDRDSDPWHCMGVETVVKVTREVAEGVGSDVYRFRVSGRIIREYTAQQQT